MQKPKLSFECSEQWEQMRPVSEGRHCGSCAKTVVDFTAMSDADIIDYLKNKQHICGRFKQTQLSVQHTLPSVYLKSVIRTPAKKQWPALLLSLGSLFIMNSCQQNAKPGKNNPADITTVKSDTTRVKPIRTDTAEQVMLPKTGKVKLIEKPIVELTGEVDPGYMGGIVAMAEETHAAFKYGNDSIQNFFNLQFSAPENVPKGEIKFGLTITTTGELSKVRIIETSPEEAYSTDLTNKIKQMLLKHFATGWEPATMNTMKVEEEVILPLVIE